MMKLYLIPMLKLEGKRPKANPISEALITGESQPMENPGKFLL